MRTYVVEYDVLDIFLHEKLIGNLTNLPGDKNLFIFQDDYVFDLERATLSLSFKDKAGDLITETTPTRTRVPPFFSNLLPEGHMREYLATQAGVKEQREFYLLAALGKDLPGALKILPSNHSEWGRSLIHEFEEERELKQDEVLRFSLAGVQLKFSAIEEKAGELTIPADGVGGSWIVKLPSSIYANVPENEFSMMGLARRVGIDVPETALISVDQISGLPSGIGKNQGSAYMIRRFDRTQKGKGIHIEDFAQVFAQFPEKKYKSASYRNIAEVIWSEIGEEGIAEFIRRFIFNVLIGNGDMHLKNWSLIYPDQKRAALAPAYDFVSTIPYIPQEELALNFVDSKKFHSVNKEQLERFAAKALLPRTLVLQTALETIQAFKEAWKSIDEFCLNQEIIDVLNRHLEELPLLRL